MSSQPRSFDALWEKAATIEDGFIKDTRATEEYILQRGDSETLKTNAAIFDQLHNQVPVPEVVMDNTENGQGLVVERREGQNFNEQLDLLWPIDLREIGVKLGDHLSTIHQHFIDRLDGHGELRYSNGLESEGYETWQQFFQDSMEEKMDGLDVLVDDMETVRETVENAGEYIPEDVEPTLLHNDLREGNVLIDNQPQYEVSAILDFDEAVAGHAAYDYVWTKEKFAERMERMNREAEKEEFEEGIEEGYDLETPDEQLENFYRAAHYIDRLSMIKYSEENGINEFNQDYKANLEHKLSQSLDQLD